MITSFLKNVIVRKDSPVFRLFPSLLYSLRKKKKSYRFGFFRLALCFFLYLWTICQSHGVDNFADVEWKMSAAIILPTTAQSPLVLWLTLSWAAVWQFELLEFVLEMSVPRVLWLAFILTPSSAQSCSDPGAFQTPHNTSPSALQFSPEHGILWRMKENST